MEYSVAINSYFSFSLYFNETVWKNIIFLIYLIHTVARVSWLGSHTVPSTCSYFIHYTTNNSSRSNMDISPFCLLLKTLILWIGMFSRVLSMNKMSFWRCTHWFTCLYKHRCYTWPMLSSKCLFFFPSGLCKPGWLQHPQVRVWHPGVKQDEKKRRDVGECEWATNTPTRFLWFEFSRPPCKPQPVKMKLSSLTICFIFVCKHMPRGGE